MAIVAKIRLYENNNKAYNLTIVSIQPCMAIVAMIGL